MEPGRFWTAPENVRWVEASLALLRAFADAGGRRAVIAGTSAEYDWTPRSERFHEERTPLRPATLYGAAKHALHTVAARYAEQAGFELAWGRIFFVYGPGEPDGRLVPSVGRGLLAGEPVPTTRGDQVRDFMHVEDVAAAFAALAEAERHGRGEHRLGRAGGGAARWSTSSPARPAGRISCGRARCPSARGTPRASWPTLRRLRDEVGFTPRIGLADGLAGTLEWLRTSDGVAS